MSPYFNDRTSAPQRTRLSGGAENISLRVVCKEPLESRTVPEPFRVGGVDVRAMQPLNPTTEAETMKTNAENRH